MTIRLLALGNEQRPARKGAAKSARKRKGAVELGHDQVRGGKPAAPALLARILALAGAFLFILKGSKPRP